MYLAHELELETKLLFPLWDFGRMNAEAAGPRLNIRINFNGNEREPPLQEPLRPPLEPPPFEPVDVRRCIRTNVRIQNHERQEEVLIPTSLTISVESMLNATSTQDREEMDDDDEDDDYEGSSDFSESSSSSDGVGGEGNDVMRDSGRKLYGDANIAAQSPVPQHRVNRMKAYWLRGDPICQVDQENSLFGDNLLDSNLHHIVFSSE